MKLSDYTMTTEDLANKLGYHVQYVRALALKGKLPALKRGRAWLFSEAEVMEHLQKQTGKNGEANGRRATDGDSLLR